jgi:uncharacterized YigZ family protein
MNKSMPYNILRPAQNKIKIQRSSFIGSVRFAPDIETAEYFIESVRREFFKATHNCFAYRIDKNQFRFSDDGEPSGTAGKPILFLLEKYDLIETVLVVTRFYGGIKLGRGGLYRAYSQCAEEIILKAGLEVIVPQINISLNYPYHFSRKIENILSKYSGRIISSDFETEVKTEILVPQELSDKFIKEVLNVGGNKIKVMEES